MYGTDSNILKPRNKFAVNRRTSEHASKTEERKAEQERKRKEALEAANSLTQAMVDHLNIGVAQAYLNEKRLDSEMRTLATNSTQFAKQTHQWLNLIENFNTALKELGHVQSWAKAIDADVKTITASLEYVYKASQDTYGSSSGSNISSSSFPVTSTSRSASGAS